LKARTRPARIIADKGYGYLRCINRLKQCRGLATHYEKRAAIYHGLVVIASIVLWLDA
jgi:transposase